MYKCKEVMDNQVKIIIYFGVENDEIGFKNGKVMHFEIIGGQMEVMVWSYWNLKIHDRYWKNLRNKTLISLLAQF